MKPLSISVALLTVYSTFILTARAELLVYYPFDTQNGVTVKNEGILSDDGTIMGGGRYGTSKDGTFGTAFIGNRAGTNNARVHTGFLGTQLGQGDNGESYTAMAWIRWDGSSGSGDHMVFGTTV